MFDIFTKSKVEAPVSAPGLSPVRPRRLDSAWRVYRAVERALRTAEAESKILAGRSRDAAISNVVSLAAGDGVVTEGGSPDILLFDNEDLAIRRAAQLDHDIACYKLMKTSLLAGFPELDRGEQEGNQGQTTAGSRLGSGDDRYGR